VETFRLRAPETWLFPQKDSFAEFACSRRTYHRGLFEKTVVLHNVKSAAMQDLWQIDFHFSSTVSSDRRTPVLGA
jgi:hypothetical protein